MAAVALRSDSLPSDPYRQRADEKDLTRYHESRHVQEGLGRPPQASSAPYPALPPAPQPITASDIAALTEHYEGILAEQFRNLSESEQAIAQAVKAGKGAVGIDLKRGGRADPHEYHNKVMDRDIGVRDLTPQQVMELVSTPDGKRVLRRRSRAR
jgi:hypothetical protein